MRITIAVFFFSLAPQRCCSSVMVVQKSEGRRRQSEGGSAAIEPEQARSSMVIRQLPTTKLSVVPPPPSFASPSSERHRNTVYCGCTPRRSTPLHALRLGGLLLVYNQPSCIRCPCSSSILHRREHTCAWLLLSSPGWAKACAELLTKKKRQALLIGLGQYILSRRTPLCFTGWGPLFHRRLGAPTRRPRANRTKWPGCRS